MRNMPKKQKRTKILRLYFTQEELKKVREAAGEYPVAMWIRAQLMTIASKQRPEGRPRPPVSNHADGS